MAVRRLARPFDLRRLGKALLVFIVLTLILTHQRHAPWLSQPAHRISTFSSATDLAASILSNPKLSASDATQQPRLAESLCKQHGWTPFTKPPASPSQGTGPGPRPRKVYDLFTVNTELDWLEIRLNTTYPFVDHFVILEAPRTFTGLEKPLHVAESWAKLAPYHDKIIHRVLEYPPGFDPKLTWDYEDLQRNSLLTQVFPTLAGDQAPSEGDVLLVADVDEIVRPETLLVLRACAFPRRLTLRSRFYYYSFQFLHRGAEWAHPQATTYRGMADTILPDDLRKGDGERQWGLLAPLVRWLDEGDLWNASWHCSNCFATLAELLRKMESFSHMSLNAPEYRDRERIVERVRSGMDLWDRQGEMYDLIEDNQDVPLPLKLERDRWRYLLERNGTSAGFSDYP